MAEQPVLELQRTRQLGLVSASATYALIVMGAVVRVTGSGLGCPDWPTCHGSWIPPLERAAFIEYAHRTMAAIVGILVLWLVVAAWRRRRINPPGFALALAAMAVLLVQAWLGRIVVLGELDAAMVTVHLGIAMVLLAVLLAIWLDPGRGNHDGWNRLSARLWVAALCVIIVIMVGGWMRGLGAGLAFEDWPLMDGALIPAGLETAARVAAFLHRLVAGAVLVYLGYLTVALRKTAWARLAGWLLGLYLLQVVIGGLTVLTNLGPVLRVAHVALGSLSWALAFATAYLAGSRRSSPVPASHP